MYSIAKDVTAVSATLANVCQAGKELIQLIGCLVTLSRETLRSTLSIVGVGIAIVDKWSAEYKAKALISSTREGRKGRSEGNSASTSR